LARIVSRYAVLAKRAKKNPAEAGLYIYFLGFFASSAKTKTGSRAIAAKKIQMGIASFLPP
jgi:hypothetical protein